MLFDFPFVDAQLLNVRHFYPRKTKLALLWCLLPWRLREMQRDRRFHISYFRLSMLVVELWLSQLGDRSDLHRVPSVPAASAERAPATPSVSILFSAGSTEIRQQLPCPPSQQREQWAAISMKSTDGLVLNISRTFIFNFVWANDRKDN